LAIESKSSHVPLSVFSFSPYLTVDVFLLLKAKESGLSDTLVIGIYIFTTFMLPYRILINRAKENADFE
jgi:hypothetical protein